MNFIRNRNFRAGPQTSLEGFICPQNSDKQQKNKVFGRSGGALLLCPIHTRAEPYTLSYSLDYPGQVRSKGSRSIKRPLVVDLVGHTLTLPSQVIGNTLTLENEDGEVYTYYIIDTTFQIPEELSGEYSLKISDGNSMYQGMIELK